MMRTVCRSTLLGLAVLAAGACVTREVSNLNPHGSGEVVKTIPVEVNRDLDILFVIDDSNSMAGEQVLLSNSFPGFIQVLESIQGGLPNVHIGVINTDVGTGPTGPCGGGDGGQLQNSPRLVGCTPPTGAFILDEAQPGGGRTTNYTGSLADTFECIAQLGSVGCGFEQHFESTWRALNGSVPKNIGFLRDHAYLAVVFLTDEDDCSAANDVVFSQPSATVNDPLGPQTSFRCTEFGIECGDPPQPITRSPDSYENCVPRGCMTSPCDATPDTYMWHPDRYVDLFKSLKDDEGLIIMAAIMGPPDPVATTTDAQGRPKLNCSCGDCQGTNIRADPGVRLAHFLDQFQHSRYVSICSADLTPALLEVADLLAQIVGTPCISGPIDARDVAPGEPGLQIQCEVADIRYPNTDDEVQTPIARCSMLDATTPDLSSGKTCWWTESDHVSCPETESHVVLHVERNNIDPPPGTTLYARCAAIPD